MLAELLLRFIEFAVRTVVLLGLLWVMTRFQRFNRKYEYRSLRLVGAAILASAVDLVPYAGHFLAVPVLWVSVKKITRADYFEAFWTIAVAYGLVLGGNGLWLGPLMGHWQAHKNNPLEAIRRPKWLERVAPAPSTTTNLQAPDTNPPVLPTNASSPQSAGNHAPAAAPRPASGSVAAGNLPGAAPAQAPQNMPTNSALNSPPPAKPLVNAAKYISVKGVTRNGANSAVSIQSGAKVYTVFLEEAVLMQTPEGPVSVRFAELETNSLTLEINGVPAKYQIR
ncbi:MAG TPA: hypothetical protein VMB80_12595 [Candidatus Acidoferrum sp.]|nr:hypothetical protein [Candidatus Acidoferrum sp.]